MKNRSEIIRVVLFFLIFFCGVTVAYFMLKPKQKLKIFNPSDINPALVDSNLQAQTKLHRVHDFELVDQQGKFFSQEGLKNKIYVVDFFFTTCQSICPKMTTQMQRVYQKYKNDDRIMFLSHTVMPEIDSAEVLNAYARQFEADATQWKFLTGSKKEIYKLARQSYFVVSNQGSGDEHDFIHTENFVLVDKNKRLRGFYDGTSEKDVNRLMEEIEVLMEEN